MERNEKLKKKSYGVYEDDKIWYVILLVVYSVSFGMILTLLLFGILNIIVTVLFVIDMIVIGIYSNKLIKWNYKLKKDGISPSFFIIW